MKPIYTDIHIHTSENANFPNRNYDVDVLVKRILEISKGEPVLISLTDHNMINKTAYKSLKEKISTVVLGVELNIRKYVDAPSYHCHMLFDCEVTDENIDRINNILDNLYPDKVITPETANVPNIEEISNAFDDFEYLLLPHGGQSHKTFDRATGKGHLFDNAMERSIYYNHFDGFTARSNNGIEHTYEYFRKLGIDQFTNLITCSDNYNPNRYPEEKNKNSNAFVPTWIFSEATFDGLKMALSEKSRLFYGETPPREWNKTIGHVSLNNNNCEIDVELTPGLNVVIGGSSSGKTLFVDSLVSGIKNDFQNNVYQKYGVEDIAIENPSKIVPHYINQNFIVSVFQNENLTLGDIEIIGEAFPEEVGVTNEIRYYLNRVKQLIEQLVDSVKKYEKIQDALSHLASPSHLIIPGHVPRSVADLLKQSEHDKEVYCIDKTEYECFIETLQKIEIVFKKASLENSYLDEIKKVKEGLEYIFNLSICSNYVSSAIDASLEKELIAIAEEDREKSQRIDQCKKMIEYVSEAIETLDVFYRTKKELEMLDYFVSTKEIKVDGHILSIENNFTVTREVLKETINKYLKKENKIDSLDDLTPELLYKSSFLKKPKVNGYDDFISKVFNDISDNNNRTYRIVTSQGKDFDSLSPGWKSAILLDLILGYDGDVAPLIIDQPEDNLATDYINHGLIEKIKKTKSKKQIVLVSHNATIPMLGDAQNVIVCTNEDGKILIKSAALESRLDGKRILDYIADITDGGKPSIRKRVKKYDLKKYKEN